VKIHHSTSYQHLILNNKQKHSHSLESDITLSDKNEMLYLHVVRSSHFDGSFFLYFLQSFFFTIQVLASKATCQYSTQALSSSDFGQNLIFIAQVGHNL
jgi:hypothetical protein